MSFDIISTVVQVKSDGITQLTKDLSDNTKAAVANEAAISKLTTSSKTSNDTSKTTAATASSLTSAVDSLLQKEQKRTDLLGASISQQLAYNVSIKGGSDAQILLAQQLGAQQDAYKRLAADQSAAIKLNNDFNASLESSTTGSSHLSGGISGITRELIVLGHEASQGNFSRFGGSLAVMAEKLNVGVMISGLFETALEAVGGSMATLITIIGGVVAVLVAGVAGLITFQHSLSAIQDFNQALILTGGAAGVSGDKLYTMAAAVGQVYGNTGKAREAVMSLAESGKFSSEQIDGITNAAVGLYTYGGVAIDKTIEQFEKLSSEALNDTDRSFSEVTKAAVEMDAQLHFLEPQVLATAIAEAKLGDQHAASATLIKALNDAENQRVEELKNNLTPLHELALTITKDFTNMWNALWTKQSPQQELAAVNAELQKFHDASTAGKIVITLDTGLNESDLLKQQADLQQKIAGADYAAKLKQYDDDVNHAANLAAIQVSALHDREKGEATLADQIAKYNKQEADMASKGVADTQAQQAADIAYITKRYSETQKKPKAEGFGDVDLQVANIKEVLATQLDADDRAMKSSANLYSAKQIDVYTDQQNTEKALQAKVAATDAAYNAEMSALQKSASEQTRTADEVTTLQTRMVAATTAHEKAVNTLNEALDKNGNLVSATLTQAYDAESLAIQKSVDSTAAKTKAVQDQIDAYNRLPDAVKAAGVTDKQMQDQITQSAVDDLQKQIDKETALGVVGQDRINQMKAELAGLQAFQAAQKTREGQQNTNTFNLATGTRQKEEAAAAVAAWQDAGKTIQTTLTDVFGAVGQSIGGMFQAYSTYMAAKTKADEDYNKVVLQQADNPDLLDKSNKVAQAQLDQIAAINTAQLASYAAMATSAQSYFSKGSTGYKLLGDVSKAFQLEEMAQALVTFVTKSAYLTDLLGIKLATDAASTASTSAYTIFDIAQSGLRTAALAIEAAVSAMVGLPFPFNLAALAATVAVLVGLGVSLTGGGGASASTSAQKQASQGTGTVLGDTNAKSDSIANSLDIVARDSGLGLVHFESMDNSLKAVVSGLSALGTTVVQTGGINDLANQIAGNQSGGWLGSVVSSIFGGNKTVTDAGISVGPSTVGQIAANGVDAQSYNDVHTSGGWFSSGSNSTQTQSLGADANKQIADIIDNLSQTVSAAATQLGIGGDAFNKQLQSFVVDIGDISLKGLSGDDVTKALNAVFSKIGDNMATAAIPIISTFAKIGEGPLETLTRVANDFQQVSDVFAVLGKNVNVTGVAAISMSEGLINVFGTIDNLTSETQEFVKDFETSAEQITPIAASVKTALAAIGESSITTTDQFEKLVQAQDLTTTAGQQMYAALLNIAPAFAQVQKAQSDLLNSQLDDQLQIANLNGDTASATAIVAQQRAIEIAGLDATLQPLQKRINDLTDEAAATQAANAVQSSSLTMQGQIATLTKNTTLAAAVLQKQRAAELLTIDASLVPLQERINYLTDEQTAITALNTAASASFAVLSAAINKSKTDSTNAFNAYSTSENALITASQATSDAMDALSSALQGALDSLDPLLVSTTQSTAQANQVLNNALVTAQKTGVLPASTDLTEALSTLSKPDDTSYTSSTAYKMAIGITAGKLADLNTIAATQKTTAQQQLAVEKAALAAATTSYDNDQLAFTQLLADAQSQLDAMNGTQVAVESLVAAITAFNTSVTTAISAAQAAGSTNAPPAPATDDQITAMYQNLLGRAPDASGLAYWESRAAAGASASQIEQEFLTSPEYLSLHPTVNGSHANGLDNVPFDGYTAKLHKGEMVLPAKQAQTVAQAGDMKAVSAAITNSVNNLNSTVTVMKADIRWMKKLWQTMVPNGQSLQTTAGPS